MKIVKLTNKRPTSEQTPEVVASPTRGSVKVTEPAAEIIGVVAGDRVEVGRDAQSGQLFVFASEDLEEGLGQKLASTSKSGGGTLSFSSANAWLELDGDTDHNTFYTLGTPVDEDGNEYGEDSEGTKYVPLKFKEKVEKQQRKSSKKDDASDDSDYAPMEVEFEEKEEQENGDPFANM